MTGPGRPTEGRNPQQGGPATGVDTGAAETLRSTPIKRAGPLTYLTIAILVAFGITDLAAEVTGDGTGRYGETFSTWIAHLDGKHWWFRAAVGVVTVVLATHLTLQVP